MRYIYINTPYIPKHCKYGPRFAEGLVFNDYEWWNITNHLYQSERDKSLVLAQKMSERAKKDISFNMTRNWENTLSSLKTLGAQKIIDKKEKEKQDKIDEYNEIMKERLEEKKELLEQVKKILFENKDSSKTINSAVFLSTVLHGRQKQIELKKAIKEEEAKANLKFCEKYKEEAEAFAKEKLQEKIDAKNKKKLQKEILDKQMKEILARKECEEREELAQQKQDLINMKEELERIKICEMEERQHKKEAARFILQHRNQTEFEKTLRLEEEEENEINKIYVEYDRKFRKERKKKEDEILHERIFSRTAMAEKIKELLREAAIIERQKEEAAFREKEAKAEEDRLNQEKLKKEEQADLREHKRLAEERRAREKYELAELKKWQLMQTYKRAELYDEWKKSEREKQRHMEADTRAYYDKQCRDLERRREEELQEKLTSLGNLVGDKAQVLRTCEEALAFVKKHDLPPYPVQVAIQKVKEELGYLKKQPCEAAQAEEPEGRRQVSRRNLGKGCYCLKD